MATANTVNMFSCSRCKKQLLDDRRASHQQRIDVKKEPAMGYVGECVHGHNMCVDCMSALAEEHSKNFKGYMTACAPADGFCHSPIQLDFSSVQKTCGVCGLRAMPHQIPQGVESSCDHVLCTMCVRKTQKRLPGAQEAFESGHTIRTVRVDCQRPSFATIGAETACRGTHVYGLEAYKNSKKEHHEPALLTVEPTPALVTPSGGAQETPCGPTRIDEPASGVPASAAAPLLSSVSAEMTIRREACSKVCARCEKSSADLSSYGRCWHVLCAKCAFDIFARDDAEDEDHVRGFIDSRSFPLTDICPECSLEIKIAETPFRRLIKNKVDAKRVKNDAIEKLNSQACRAWRDTAKVCIKPLAMLWLGPLCWPLVFWFVPRTKTILAMLQANGLPTMGAIFFLIAEPIAAMLNMVVSSFPMFFSALLVWIAASVVLREGEDSLRSMINEIMTIFKKYCPELNVICGALSRLYETEARIEAELKALKLSREKESRAPCEKSD